MHAPLASSAWSPYYAMQRIVKPCMTRLSSSSNCSAAAVPVQLRATSRCQMVCAASPPGGSDTSQVASENSGMLQQVAQPRPASQWQRFQGFVQAGDGKEAWLCISASTLKFTLPAALLAVVLHGSLWGGAPPAVVTAGEAAAYAGAAVAAATELWKVLEGFQG